MDAQTAYIVAQGISIVTGILAIVLKQMKDMKHILLLEVIANSLAALNYIFVGGLGGGIVSGIAVLNAIVMLAYYVSDKKAPTALTVVFIGIYTVSAIINLIASGDPMELLPAVAAFCYSISMMQKKASVYRLWSLLNPIIWMIYDLYTKSYVMFVVHLGIAISTLSAMIRLDSFLGIVKKPDTDSEEDSETRQ